MLRTSVFADPLIAEARGTTSISQRRAPSRCGGGTAAIPGRRRIAASVGAGSATLAAM